MLEARLPAHRHPQSNNQVSPCENLVENGWAIEKQLL